MVDNFELCGIWYLLQPTFTNLMKAFPPANKVVGACYRNGLPFVRSPDPRRLQGPVEISSLRSMITQPFFPRQVFEIQLIERLLAHPASWLGSSSSSSVQVCLSPLWWD